MLKLIRINLLVFLVLILLLELFGQVFFLLRNKQFLFAVDEIRNRERLFVRHPYLSVTLRKDVETGSEKDGQYMSVKTTSLGTRWTGADMTDTAAIRIACVGGSTTFCTGVDDEDSWPAQLQQKLGKRFAVVNYGVPSYNTVEGIIQLALYIPELKPDLVIFHQGANDMYNYYMENNYPDYHHHGENLMPMALLAVSKYERCTQYLSRVTGVGYLIQKLRVRMYSPVKPELRDEPDPVVDSLFVRNLHSMLALTSAMQAKPVFISQVMNPFFREWSEHPYMIRVNPELIVPFTEKLNQNSRMVCESHPHCGFLDLMNEIAWEPDHFWDEMHFSKSGNEIFARKLGSYIMELYE
jgi:lysophospholipase L1-like esterase